MPAIQPITAVPAFVSEDEHASIVASTPSSFSDIPAVIRHKEENAAVAVDPPFPGLSGDELKGTLYVLTRWVHHSNVIFHTFNVLRSVLVFFSTSGRGFQVEYPSITLHAVSRGESGPSIYCQLDETCEEQNGAAEDEYSEMRELSIIPSTPDSRMSSQPTLCCTFVNGLHPVEAIFEALSYCASLHPDNDTEDEVGLDDDAFIDPSSANFETFAGGEGEELSEVGRVRSDFSNNNRFAPY
jgi:nucleotide-sensitive chloride channel 1A